MSSRFGTDNDAPAKWEELHSQISQDPDNFSLWTALVNAVDQLNGGINKNSQPEDLNVFRSTYDTFLLKFPLLFAYWIKYAKKEFYIGYTERSLAVYERAVAAIPSCVEIWSEYCSFKTVVCHDDSEIRQLFERAVQHCGLHFMAHLLWDAYIKFEESRDDPTRIFSLLDRVSDIPLHQSAVYYQRIVSRVSTAPLAELLTPAELAALTRDVRDSRRNELLREGHSVPERAEDVKIPKAEIEEKIRAILLTGWASRFARLQQQIYSRWWFEAEIKRPYFHVTYLDQAQLATWHKYLDYEMIEGDHARIRTLFERCLVAAAWYEEMWIKYVDWLLAQGYIEEARGVYRRGAFLLPTGRPALRLHYALFEESQGKLLAARDIALAVLDYLPGHAETFVLLANLQRKLESADAAAAMLKEGIDSEYFDEAGKAVLLREAKLLLTGLGQAQECRSLFAERCEKFASCYAFWQLYVDFEIDQALLRGAGAEDKVYRLVKTALAAPLQDEEKGKLARSYMRYLHDVSGSGSLKKYLALDAQYNRWVPEPEEV